MSVVVEHDVERITKGMILEGLEDARSLLMRGWIRRRQYKLTPTGPAYCMTGALWQAAGMDFTASDAQRLLQKKEKQSFYSEMERAIQSYIRGGGIINFNDYSARKKEEVIDVFDRAIEGLKENQ